MIVCCSRWQKAVKTKSNLLWASHILFTIRRLHSVKKRWKSLICCKILRCCFKIRIVPRWIMCFHLHQVKPLEKFAISYPLRLLNFASCLIIPKNLSCSTPTRYDLIWFDLEGTAYQLINGATTGSPPGTQLGAAFLWQKVTGDCLTKSDCCKQAFINNWVVYKNCPNLLLCFSMILQFSMRQPTCISAFRNPNWRNYLAGSYGILSL